MMEKLINSDHPGLSNSSKPVLLSGILIFTFCNSMSLMCLQFCLCVSVCAHVRACVHISLKTTSHTANPENDTEIKSRNPDYTDKSHKGSAPSPRGTCALSRSITRKA